MTDATVESMVPGCIGEPGSRTFYLQVDDAGRHSYLLEKGQVAGFAVEAMRLLGAIGREGSGSAMTLGDIDDPDEVVFRIAAIDLGYDETTELVSVTLLPTDESAAPVVHLATPEQLDAAARHGAELVAAGRPLCPRCGLAMDPDGHICPTTNGDLRGHRP